MKNTISDNRQIFNVKAIATAGLTPEQIPNNQFGLINVATGLTVVPGSYSAFPDRARIVSKLNGKLYYSFDDIEKDKIHNIIITEPVTAVPEKWEAVIKHCDCIEGFVLKIGYTDVGENCFDDNSELIVGVQPKELNCECNDDGTLGEKENNLVTFDIINKIDGSDYVDAYAQFDVSGLPTTDPSSAGDLFVDGTDLKVSGGGIVGTVDTDIATITDPDGFMAANDDIYLTLVIEGKALSIPDYSDLEPMYKYPYGVVLTPSLEMNRGSVTISFTKTQDLVYAKGVGADLRATEFDIMSLHTNLNHQPMLADKFINPKLKYQFENGTTYGTVTFEFGSKKSGLEEVFEGPYKRFSVILGSDSTNTGVWNAVKAMFT